MIGQILTNSYIVGQSSIEKEIVKIKDYIKDNFQIDGDFFFADNSGYEFILPAATIISKNNKKLPIILKSNSQFDFYDLLPNDNSKGLAFFTFEENEIVASVSNLKTTASLYVWINQNFTTNDFISKLNLIAEKLVGWILKYNPTVSNFNKQKYTTDYHNIFSEFYFDKQPISPMVSIKIDFPIHVNNTQIYD